MTSEKEKVLTNLRACLISSQGGVKAEDLNKDYKCLVGEHVPFRRLGFSNLETFLAELPNVDIRQKNGEWWVQAKMGKDSSHIQLLVQGQQKSKSRKPKRRAHYNTRSSATASRYSYKPSHSQVPHFMQTKKPSLQPSPKPKAQYITAASTSRRTAATLQNNDWAQKVMPTVVIEPKKAPVSQSHSEPIRPTEKPSHSRPIPVPEESTFGTQIRPPHEEHRTWPVAVRMRNPTENSARRPALLPTPTQAPGPVMPPPSVSRTPYRLDLHVSPAPYTNHSSKLSHPVANPLLSLLDTPQVPTTKRPQSKPHKSSVAERLLKHKANAPKNNAEGSLLESLEEMNLQMPTNNGTSTTSNGESRHVTSVPFKFVNPTSHKNKKFPNGDASLSTRGGANFLPEFAHDDSSFIIKLARYADEQNWPVPEFLVLTRRVKKGPKPEFFYLGRACISCTPAGSEKSKDDNSKSYEFSSFPEEFNTPLLAVNCVAKKAYEALLGTSTIKLPETKEHRVIYDRINQMISGKPQGVWLFEIEREYTTKFNEVLPSNLPDLLKQECPNLEVTKLAEAYYIIRPRAEQLPNSPGKVCDSSAVIGKVALPSDNYWDVFVTKMKSLNEVYVRLIGENYSAVFEELCNLMDNYYMKPPSNGTSPVEPPEFIQLGSYYAYLSEPDRSAYRCMVTGTVNNEYQIYLIDIGDVEFVAASSLRKLLPDFHELPSQALPCYLEQLDNFDFALSDTNPELSGKVLDMIVGKSYATVVQSREPIRLFLFDTDSDVDINMNHVVRGMVLESFTDPIVAFQEKGFLKAVNVSCIDSQGRVFVQKPSWTLDCLHDKFSMIGNGVFEVLHVKEQNVSFEKLYCVSSSPTRVKILEILGSGKLLVDCVDTGGVIEMDLIELLEVPQLDDILPRIPPQAVQVLMHDIRDGTLTPEQSRRCLEAINSTDQPAIGKIIAHIEEMPVMELFIRNEKNRFLMSLNQNVILMNDKDAAPVYDDDALSISGASVASFATNVTGISKADTSISSRPGTTCSRFSFDSPFGQLTAPSKSESVFNKGPVSYKINDELDVYVTRIASPHNFTVIPVKYLSFLNTLIDEMTVYYSSMSPTASYAPQLKECVAAFSSGCWFRVQIDKQLDSDCYSGRFLDQGHMEMFATKCLRVLHDKFKKLPYLAFKGQLHGVKPVNGMDWEVDDCIRLKEMIHGKKLVSIVRDVINDGDGKTLSLEIIDTSTDADIYVSRQLVVERRALSAE